MANSKKQNPLEEFFDSIKDADGIDVTKITTEDAAELLRMLEQDNLDRQLEILMKKAKEIGREHIQQLMRDGLSAEELKQLTISIPVATTGFVISNGGQQTASPHIQMDIVLTMDPAKMLPLDDKNARQIFVTNSKTGQVNKINIDDIDNGCDCPHCTKRREERKVQEDDGLDTVTRKFVDKSIRKGRTGQA
jgi:hypothetical protein